MVDVCYSFNVVSKIRKFAKENNVLIKYEELKHHIRKSAEDAKEKYRFLLAFSTREPLKEYLKKYIEKLKLTDKK